MINNLFWASNETKSNKGDTEENEVHTFGWNEQWTAHGKPDDNAKEPKLNSKHAVSLCTVLYL